MIYTATTTIQFRMNAALKQQVEQKLDNLPKSVNADKMTDDELRDHLLTGYQEALDGKSRPAAEVFTEMKANTIIWTQCRHIAIEAGNQN